MPADNETSAGNRLANLLTNQTVKNSYFSMLDVMLMPVLMLAATPIFLSELGAAQYGVWMLVNSIVASIGIADIGAADATIKSISAYRGSDDKSGIRRIFSTACALYLGLGAVISVAGFMAAPYAVDSGLFKVDAEFQDVFTASLRIGVFLFSIKLLETLLLAFFKGYERYDLSSKISMAARILTIAAQVITVVLGGSLASVFMNSLIVHILVILAIVVALKRFDSTIRLLPALDKSALKEILDFSLWAWLCAILGIVSMQIDKWIIGSLAGMTTLAYYSIAALVSNNLRAIIAAGASWVFPRVSSSGIRSESSRRLYFNLQLVVVGSAIAVSLVLLIADQAFLVWLGKDAFSESIGFINGYLLLLPIAATTIVPYYYITGGGFIRYNVIYRLVLSTTSILLMLALYPIFEVYGIILAYALSYSIVSSVQRSILEKHAFHERTYFSGFFILLPAIFFVAGYLMLTLYHGVTASSLLFLVAIMSFAWLGRRHTRSSVGV